MKIKYLFSYVVAIMLLIIIMTLLASFLCLRVDAKMCSNNHKGEYTKEQLICLESRLNECFNGLYAPKLGSREEANKCLFEPFGNLIYCRCGNIYYNASFDGHVYIPEYISFKSLKKFRNIDK